MTDKIAGYGLLVDLNRPRQDGGASGLWDGWYASRELAMEALRLFRAAHPDARAQLVAQLDERTTAGARADHS